MSALIARTWPPLWLLLGLLLAPSVSASEAVLLEVRGPKRQVPSIAAALTDALNAQGRAPVRVLMPASPRPDQLRAALRKAGATAWVRATVRGKQVRLEVFDAEGVRQGVHAWKLTSARPRALPAPVSAALRQALPSAAPAPSEPVAPVEAAPPPPPEPVARVERAPPPPPEPAAERAPEPVPSAGEPPPVAAANAPTVLELSLAGAAFSRELSYQDDLFEALSSYRLPAGPAFALEVNLFPGAWSGVLSELGLLGELTRSAWVSSREGERIFPTERLSLELGVVYRREVGPFELRGAATVISDRFELRPAADGSPAPRVPAVAYVGPRAFAEARVRLWALTAALGVGYRHPFAVGELNARDYFPHLTGAGVDGSLRLHWAFTPALGLQAAVQYRRYFWAMNSQPGDPLVAGGALDQHLHANLGFAVWLR